MRLSKLCGRVSDFADSGFSALCKLASTFRLAILNKPARVVSFDKRNLRTLTLLNSQVSKTVASTRYSLRVRSVNCPSAILRYLANRFIACSALLLFQGMPSCSRNVNIFVPLFWNRFFYLSASSDVKSDDTTDLRKRETTRLCFLRCRLLRP